jgi:hypothetical protein
MRILRAADVREALCTLRGCCSLFHGIILLKCCIRSKFIPLATAEPLCDEYKTSEEAEGERGVASGRMSKVLVRYMKHSTTEAHLHSVRVEIDA